MNNQGNLLCIALIGEMRGNLGLPAEHLISAALLGIQKMGLGIEDGRGVLERLRLEWGMGSYEWAGLVLKQMREFRPPEATVRELVKPT